MFSKLCAVLAVAVPFASALTVDPITGANSGGQITITWSSAAGDPNTWSFFLVNPVFHDTFAIANTVNPQPGALNVTLPIVPADSNYQLEATNVGNQSDVFAISSTFAIGALVTTSTSGSSTIVSTVSVSPTSNANVTSLPTQASTFGVTQSPSTTGSSSGSSNSPSTTSGTTSSGSAPSTTPLNGAMAGVSVSRSSVASLALMVVAAVAGAGFVGI